VAETILLTFHFPNTQKIEFPSDKSGRHTLLLTPEKRVLAVACFPTTPTDSKPPTMANPESQTLDTEPSTESTKKRFAVSAETVHDPHHNYTILGRIVTLDMDDYPSLEAAAQTAVTQAAEAMAETIETDILDDQLKVFVIENSVHVPVPTNDESTTYE
jgi:hypothetical protein